MMKWRLRELNDKPKAQIKTKHKHPKITLPLCLLSFNTSPSLCFLFDKHFICTCCIPSTLLGAGGKGSGSGENKRAYDLIMEKLRNCLEQYLIKCQLSGWSLRYRSRFLGIISSEKEKVAVVEEVSKHLMKNAGIEEEEKD